MKIHPIQTGWVRIKTAQVEGRGQGLRRRLSVITDGCWTDWLPTYAWAIEHREGVIVVDAGRITRRCTCQPTIPRVASVSRAPSSAADERCHTRALLT
jgi:hypothetical protein